MESNPSPSADDIEQIKQIQSELENIRAEKNEGRIIRSRARWYEEGEKGSSRYFFNLEKRNYESKLIPCLNIENKEIRCPNEILDALSKHFESLFKKQNEFTEYEASEYLKDTISSKLSPTEIEFLDKEISVEELGETLKKLANNKSPGSDGFPYEFFKMFWGDIKHFVHRSLLSGLKKGELSVTQREGLITLVPKPSKPRNLISSWRPITLLNSTYKILSATVANRLKKVLDSIIHPDQTAFLKNRFIGENTRVTYDVLYDAFSTDQKGMMLSIDFKSAFDVMNWEFLKICLRKFNFGTKFIETFACLHNNIFSRVMYNGNPSKSSIRLERGCRQGDPVSCYFFILGAEILSNRIRHNNNIKGLKNW